VLSGGTATFAIKVTNTGNVALNQVVVNDPLAPDCNRANVGPLAPGASTNYNCTVSNVTASFTNVVTATGTPPSGPPVSDSDNAQVVVPGIDIEKATNGEDADSPTGPVVAVGSTVTWTYVFTNTGNVNLTGVTVTDDQGVGVSCPKTVLQPGEAMTCTASGTATAGQYANLGTATGTPPEGGGTPPTDSDPSHYFGGSPALSLVKTATPKTYAAVGDTISYSYLVTNTGNVTLAGPVTVSDDKATVTCPAGGLAPQESMTCTASYTITLADLMAGSVKNIAQASANGTDSNRDDETVRAVVPPAVSIPTTSAYGLALLTLLLAWMGRSRMRRMRR
jgi:hypothetical protein